MNEVQTLEAALGFAAGVTFMTGVLWTFIILPLKKQLELAMAEAKSDREELKNRLIQDLEVYRRSNTA